MTYQPPPWTPKPWPVFLCSRCQAEHPCPPRDERGVWPFPATATTERGEGGGYVVRCAAECVVKS